MNFSNAKSYCESQGTSLASIPTYENYQDARSACMPARCWIGLQDDINGTSEGRWIWTDGTDITTSYGFYVNRTAKIGQGPWNSGEPSESGQEDCVSLTIDGYYNDNSCSNLRLPLCNPGLIFRNDLISCVFTIIVIFLSKK